MSGVEQENIGLVFDQIEGKWIRCKKDNNSFPIFFLIERSQKPDLITDGFNILFWRICRRSEPGQHSGRDQLGGGGGWAGHPGADQVHLPRAPRGQPNRHGQHDGEDDALLNCECQMFSFINTSCRFFWQILNIQVRHPFVRLVSAYEDKMLNPHPFPFTYHHKIQETIKKRRRNKRITTINFPKDLLNSPKYQQMLRKQVNILNYSWLCQLRPC